MRSFPDVPAGAGGYLRSYLGERLAVATALTELSARAARTAPAEMQRVLSEVHVVARGNEESLRQLVRDAAPERVGRARLAGIVLERAGRLKPNGHLLRRSPLTPLVELEGLVLALTAAEQTWRVLAVLADGERSDGRSAQADALSRARKRVESLRAIAVNRAFGDGSAERG